MHVDFRPRLLLLLGVGMMLVTFVFGYMEVIDRWIDLWGQVKAASFRKTGKELDLIDYLTDCLPSAQCKAAYANTMGMNKWMLLALHTNFLMGLVFATSAKFWKPERWYRRQARVASARMIDWFERSNAKPRRTLEPKRVGT
jgi:hypothetical protein